MRKLLFALIMLVNPYVASAAGESCNALLNLGLYNVTQSSSASDGQSLTLSSFCSADYSSSSISSSQSAAIEASYGMFGGSASGSSGRQEIITKQSQLCTSGFDSNKYSNQASDYSKTVYQGALDAWNKCQALANQGLVFDVQPSSTMQGISVSITAPTGFAATFYGVTQYGSGQSTCTIMANGKVLPISSARPFKFNASSKVTVTCKREMIVNDQDLSADAQDLVFVTSADNLTIPLAAIGSFSRVTADKIKADANLNAQALVDRLKTQLTDGSIMVESSNNSIQSSVAPTIFCSQGGSKSGRGGGYSINFTANDCGGTLPDSNYIGAAVTIQICGGLVEWSVFQPPTPGVYVYANGPCGGYRFSAIYVKVK